MKNMTNLRKGVFLAFITAVISGFSIFYSKISVAKIDPLVMATSRNLYVGLLFIVPLFFNQGIKQIRSLSKKEIVLLVLIGLIGGGIPFYLFFSGIKLVGAQTANIIHKSLFIWVILLSGLFLKEKINLGYILGGGLVFAGIYLFSPFKPVFGTGEQLIFIATLLWAVENIIAKKVLSKTSSELVGMFRMGVGGLLLLAVTLATGKGKALIGINTMQIQTIFVGGTLLFFYVFTWYKSLKYAPAGLVTAILTFSLVIGNVLNGSLAHAKLLPKDYYSMLFITIGVITLILTKPFLGYVSRFVKVHDK